MTERGFTVEQVGAEDAPALAELHYLSHTTSFAAFASPEWVASRRLDDYRRQWSDFFARQAPGSRAWAVRIEGRLAGMVKVAPEPEPGLAQLTSMHVHPDFQGRGIGRALLETAVEFMKGAGYQRAILGVIQANDKARGLYESGGWQVLERREKGIEGVPIATMWRSLGEGA